MNEQINFIEKIQSLQEQASRLQLEYWNLYSNLGTWQFWFVTGIFIIPLIALFFLIDRRRIFLLGFYGLNIHMWASYADSYGVRFGLWNHYYRMLPWFPFSFAIHVSLFPIIFILTYQWTIKHNKSFYLYSTGTALAFSFVIMPILDMMNIYKLRNGMNYFYVFLVSIAIVLVSKMITNIFIRMEKNTSKA